MRGLCPGECWLWITISNWFDGRLTFFCLMLSGVLWPSMVKGSVYLEKIAMSKKKKKKKKKGKSPWNWEVHIKEVVEILPWDSWYSPLGCELDAVIWEQGASVTSLGESTRWVVTPSQRIQRQTFWGSFIVFIFTSHSQSPFLHILGIFRESFGFCENYKT